MKSLRLLLRGYAGCSAWRFEYAMACGQCSLVGSDNAGVATARTPRRNSRVVDNGVCEPTVGARLQSSIDCRPHISLNGLNDIMQRWSALPVRHANAAFWGWAIKQCKVTPLTQCRRSIATRGSWKQFCYRRKRAVRSHARNFRLISS